MHRATGRTRLKPKPANKLLINPVILGFENKQQNDNRQQAE